MTPVALILHSLSLFFLLGGGGRILIFIDLALDLQVLLQDGRVEGVEGVEVGDLASCRLNHVRVDNAVLRQQEMLDFGLVEFDMDSVLASQMIVELLRHYGNVFYFHLA